MQSVSVHIERYQLCTMLERVEKNTQVIFCVLWFPQRTWLKRAGLDPFLERAKQHSHWLPVRGPVSWPCSVVLISFEKLKTAHIYQPSVTRTKVPPEKTADRFSLRAQIQEFLN